MRKKSHRESFLCFPPITIIAVLFSICHGHNRCFFLFVMEITPAIIRWNKKITYCYWILRIIVPKVLLLDSRIRFNEKDPDLALKKTAKKILLQKLYYFSK